MARKRKKPTPTLSAFKGMWLFTLFDLPVGSTSARRAYTRFHHALIRQGFTMLQFSVYARYCASEEKSDAVKSKLQPYLPSAGQVRLVAITDHQFGKMLVFEGKKRGHPEDPPEQLLLF